MRELRPAKGEYVNKIATTSKDVEIANSEIELWNSSDWEERSILAPIVDVTYNGINNIITTFPIFYPLFSKEEAMNIDPDEAFVELQRKMLTFGYSDEEIGLFLRKVTDFCVTWNIDIDGLFDDLSNIGYNPTFGVRIIEYGKVRL